MIDVHDLLTDEQLAAWVTYAAGIQVKVGFITEDVLWQLTVQATDKSGKVDRRKLMMLIAERALLNWKGFMDGEDELVCNKENIKKLLTRLTGLAKFVETAATEYVLLKNFRLAEEKKRSDSGPETGHSIKESVAIDAET